MLTLSKKITVDIVDRVDIVDIVNNVSVDIVDTVISVHIVDLASASEKRNIEISRMYTAKIRFPEMTMKN